MIYNKNQIVSIITSVHNRSDLTKDYLNSILINNTFILEIIIVNNNSTDNTINILEIFKKKLKDLNISLKIINNTINQPFSIACNQGADLAEGKYLLFLNNDVRIFPKFIENLIETFNYPSCGISGAKLLDKDLTIKHSGIVFVNGNGVKHIFKGFDYTFFESCKLEEYQAVTGASLMIEKNLFRKVQGFSEDYYNCFEDLDLCFKVRELGYKIVYNPNAIALHLESKKSGPTNPETEKKSDHLFMQKWKHKINDDAQKISNSYKFYDEFRNKKTGSIDLSMLLQKALNSFKQNNFFATIHYYKLLFRISPLNFSREAIEQIVIACLKINQYKMAEFFLKRSVEISGGLKEFNYHESSLSLCLNNELFNLPFKNKKPKSNLISILISVYNNLESTKNCLESIFLCSDIDYELIIVNNNATDGTLSYLAETKQNFYLKSKYCCSIKIINNQEKKSFAINMNQAARKAKGKYLVLLDSNIKVKYKWLSHFLQTINLDTSIGAIGATVLNEDNTIRYTGIILQQQNLPPLNFLQGVDYQCSALNQRREFNAIPTSCMFLRAEAFKLCNGFNEMYKDAYEDIDFCLKLKISGYKIMFEPKIIVCYNGKKIENKHKTLDSQVFYNSWGEIYQDYCSARESYECIDFTSKQKQDKFSFKTKELSLLNKLESTKKLFADKKFINYLELIEPIRHFSPEFLTSIDYFQISEAYLKLGNQEMAEIILTKNSK